MPKFTDHDAFEIMTHYSLHYSNDQIASMFGIPRERVDWILSNDKQERIRNGTAPDFVLAGIR